VVQEVFLRLHQGTRPWFKGAAFRTWLYRVVLNVSRELGRRHHRADHCAEPDTLAQLVDPGCGPEVHAELGQLARALQRLPARQREVMVLRYLEGLSTEETARILGCRSGSVKTHLHRATRAVRHWLETEEISE